MKVYYAYDLEQIYVEGTAQLWAPLSLIVATYPDGLYICTALTGVCILGPLTPALVQRQYGTGFADLSSAVSYLQGEFSKRPASVVITPYPITATASFTVNHGLAYAPRATVVDPTGAEADTDVIHAPGQTTLIFATPFTGTLYLG